MQTQVREMYLKVIEATVENARAEFVDNGVAAPTVAHLETLRQRWRERLLQTQDFSEDPMFMRGGGGASSSRSATRSVRAGQIVSMGPAGLPAGPGVRATGGMKAEAVAVGASAGAGASSGAGSSAGRGSKRKGDDTGPPSKRARRTAEEEDDDEKYKDDSELGSSSGDSDIQSAGSDPEVDNFILAQHDRVRKGGKWKVQLKEGIAHINGRDYLFNKATCDLDW